MPQSSSFVMISQFKEKELLGGVLDNNFSDLFYINNKTFVANKNKNCGSCSLMYNYYR